MSKMKTACAASSSYYSRFLHVAWVTNLSLSRSPITIRAALQCPAVSSTSCFPGGPVDWDGGRCGQQRSFGAGHSAGMGHQEEAASMPVSNTAVDKRCAVAVGICEMDGLLLGVCLRAVAYTRLACTLSCSEPTQPWFIGNESFLF